jgi:hypothetical protein
MPWKTGFHCVEKWLKPASIVWKIFRNTFPLCGKPRKHGSIVWNFLRHKENRRLHGREGAAPSALGEESGRGDERRGKTLAFAAIIPQSTLAFAKDFCKQP